MRRPAALVFFAVAALILAGCTQSAGSSSWTPEAGSNDNVTAQPTPDDDRSDAAKCLEGTWQVDEIVLAAVFQAAFVGGIESEGGTADVHSLNASQIVTLSRDETFTSATTIDADMTAANQGRTAPVQVVFESTSSGTWRIVDEAFSVSILETSGTMSTTVAGVAQSEDSDDNLLLLPPYPKDFTCQDDMLVVNNPIVSNFTGLSDEITYTRK
ncbi:MAG: hypothetical protein FWD11_11735 [Micrococcales bacterium]|nr:hypothetical protein [Micrococcales bacterium]